MNRLDELNSLLSSKLSELEDKKNELENFELNPDDFEDSYCDMLDELDVVKIGSLEYQASYVLREVDPTAYRCGLVDYVDGLDKEDSEEYKAIEEEIEALESEIEDLEEEIENLEDEEDE